MVREETDFKRLKPILVPHTAEVRKLRSPIVVRNKKKQSRCETVTRRNKNGERKTSGQRRRDFRESDSHGGLGMYSNLAKTDYLDDKILKSSKKTVVLQDIMTRSS